MITEKLLLELHEYVNDKKINDIQSFNVVLEIPMEMEATSYSKNENRSESFIHPKRVVTFENRIHNEIEKYIETQSEETFTQVLFNFIDKKGTKDSVVYKKAGIDKKHFSKIRSNPKYKPGKNTVMALAIALELDKDNAFKLLGSAGYSLSNSDTYDLVILFCLEKKLYNIHEVNMALDSFNLKPLSRALE